MQISSPYPSVQPSIPDPKSFPSPPFVWTALTSQSIGHVDELYIAALVRVDAAGGTRDVAEDGFVAVMSAAVAKLSKRVKFLCIY